MPANVKFMDKANLLSSAEIFRICSVLNDFGIDEIRLTGGEPTIREEFKEIVLKLSELKLKKLGLTTNGYLLGKKLGFLKETACQYINISLDSLQEDKFNQITNSNKFKEVYSAILKARELGFKTRINTVMLKGINDNEINNFIEFSAKNDIEVIFIELMKIGQANQYNQDLFMSAGAAIQKIKETERLLPIGVNKDSTSFKYKTASGGKIGFIASESRPFCHSCSRIRLSATGKLRACIMSEAGINLKGLNPDDYDKVLRRVIEMKPYERIEFINQPMYEIGG